MGQYPVGLSLFVLVHADLSALTLTPCTYFMYPSCQAFKMNANYSLVIV